MSRIDASSLRLLARSPSVVLAAAFLSFIVLCTVFPSVVANVNGLYGNVSQRLLSPSIAHLFGTDPLGRDLFTRIVYGAATSFSATTIAVFIGASVGTALGLAAGFASGAIEAVILRLFDVGLAVPSLLFSLAIVAALGAGSAHVAIAVGISTIAMFGRVMRAEVLRVKQEPYVEAARAAGVRSITIAFRHVLPNAASPVVALIALEIGAAMLAISSLSFLGFGAPPPAPEWGSLAAQGRNYIATAWWLTTMPGLVIIGVVVAGNRIGHALSPKRPMGM
jgi:peptide/nickel transport system permease protein